MKLTISNMLAKATDVAKGEATYTYNGMGKRVAVVNPEEKIEYLLDLTKDYHNMLERSVNGETEVYTYDSNVVSMSKAGNDYFYMLDELGTGMYLKGTDGIATTTYAYDEFGRNLNPYTGKREKPSYTKQGNIIQPLAFTGYQHDEMTDSYFAQARYYNSDAGRFVSEDKIRGFIDKPDTINHYLYCWNDPVDMEDLDGNCPLIATMGIGAAVGGLIGGGSTIVSSMVKGEDINWKEVGKNTLIGAGTGLAIGSGAGLLEMAAGATVVSTTAASTMTICGGVVGTSSAVIESGRQIAMGEDIDMFKISTAGAAGTLSGIVTGGTSSILSAGFLNAGISATQSVVNDVRDNKSIGDIGIDAVINGTSGFAGGIIGGAGAMHNVLKSTRVISVRYTDMNRARLALYGTMISGKETLKYVKWGAFSGLVKGIGWSIGVNLTQILTKIIDERNRIESNITNEACSE